MNEATRLLSRLALGYWQSMIPAELRGPRERSIHVQVLGVPENSKR
jgi:thiamine phosphate synthase YjbQ (UPF0047 family)